MLKMFLNVSKLILLSMKLCVFVLKTEPVFACLTNVSQIDAKIFKIWCQKLCTVQKIE